jgi:hypothetical protein
MEAKPIPFSYMKDMWDHWVWPNTAPNPPVDPRHYLGGTDIRIQAKYSPTYFGIQPEKIIWAAIGGHKTNDHMYRVRGLFLYEDIDSELYSTMINSLLSKCRQQARSEGCLYLWDMVPEDHPLLYHGFDISEEGDGFVYIISKV